MLPTLYTTLSTCRVHGDIFFLLSSLPLNSFSTCFPVSQLWCRAVTSTVSRWFLCKCLGVGALDPNLPGPRPGVNSSDLTSCTMGLQERGKLMAFRILTQSLLFSSFFPSLQLSYCAWENVSRTEIWNLIEQIYLGGHFTPQIYVWGQNYLKITK